MLEVHRFAGITAFLNGSLLMCCLLLVCCIHRFIKIEAICFDSLDV
jgi:hypothetical protein